MFSLCCLSNRVLLCGSPSKELLLNGRILAGCKFIVMKFCLMNKEKALRSDALRYSTKRYRRL